MRSRGVASAHGCTGQANQAVACSATSMATTLSLSGRTHVWGSQTTAMFLRSRAKAGATTQASPTGGGLGTTKSERPVERAVECGSSANSEDGTDAVTANDAR